MLSTSSIGTGLPSRLDVQQVAQMDRRVGLHRRGILLPQVIGRPVAGRLQHVHRLRFPGVLFARPPRLVEPADGQHVRAPQPALGVDLLQLLLNPVRPMPEMRLCMPGKYSAHHRTAQAHRLEVQPAAIGRDDRDPHLRHDLQKTRVDGIAIAPHRVGQLPSSSPAINPVGNGILRQIGVHRRRPADQHRKVMRIDAFRRPHVDRTERPQPLARQPAMHRAGGKDHRHRHPPLALMLIRQHQMPGTRPHGILGLGPDALQPLPQVVAPRDTGKVQSMKAT
jgi:hypothetical protein